MESFILVGHFFHKMHIILLRYLKIKLTKQHENSAVLYKRVWSTKQIVSEWPQRITTLTCLNRSLLNLLSSPPFLWREGGAIQAQLPTGLVAQSSSPHSNIPQAPRSPGAVNVPRQLSQTADTHIQTAWCSGSLIIPHLQVCSQNQCIRKAVQPHQNANPCYLSAKHLALVLSPWEKREGGRCLSFLLSSFVSVCLLQYGRFPNPCHAQNWCMTERDSDRTLFEQQRLRTSEPNTWPNIRSDAHQLYKPRFPHRQ